MDALCSSETFLINSTLKMEAVCFSETAIPTYKTTTRCHDLIWEFINVSLIYILRWIQSIYSLFLYDSF
jgi:hypothetical protein